MTKCNRAIVVIAALTLSACSSGQPHDALARLKPEPGPTITLPASELVAEDAQQFLIACPNVPAITVTQAAGGTVDLPDEGYDEVLNAFIVITSDSGVITQRYSREEIDLCTDDFPDPLTKRDASTPLTFAKEGTQWRLVG
ncbi:hypothetical protein [Corynebacterium hindlerae]|uniref:hypothetical protein n=1 Tax=Corynebacterium hindlerae TaxID=699041 RepID=UPI003AAD856F